MRNDAPCWLALALGAIFTGVASADAPRPGMLIVVPKSLLSTLAPFVEYKRGELSVECVELEEILKHESGVDDPERLKRFLSRQCATGRADFHRRLLNPFPSRTVRPILPEL